MSHFLEQHEESAIEELARDYNANWMTAVEMIDDDIYVGAENSYNLFTVRKNNNAVMHGRLEGQAGGGRGICEQVPAWLAGGAPPRL